MTAQQFLDLSTRLVADMQAWVSEAANDSTLSPADLATLRAATQIVERITVREVVSKADTEPEAGTIIL